MAIGSWGPIAFSVSDSYVLTFKSFNRTVGSTWATHSRVGLKDQPEYLRPKLQKGTFTIELDANYGVNPRAVIEQLEECSESGEVHAFVIGGRRVGHYNWRLTDVGEAWDVIYNRGELTNAKLNITMEEYL